MGVARRFYEVLRANLNALLDRAAERERATRPAGREEPEDEPRRPADREIAQHYANLELPNGADLETVRRQYRRLMGRYHPDRHQEDPRKTEVANRLAAELTRSYDALCAYLEKKGRA